MRLLSRNIFTSVNSNDTFATHLTKNGVIFITISGFELVLSSKWLNDIGSYDENQFVAELPLFSP